MFDQFFHGRGFAVNGIFDSELGKAPDARARKIGALQFGNLELHRRADIRTQGVVF